jgi:hypothetical protein
MTEDRMALIEAISKANAGSFLVALAETVLQIIMDDDVEARVGGRRHLRLDGRLTPGLRIHSLQRSSLPSPASLPAGDESESQGSFRSRRPGMLRLCCTAA